MLKEKNVYVVAYKDEKDEVTGFDWYSQFCEATRQFNFAVDNSEGPGHTVAMYSGVVQYRDDEYLDTAVRNRFDSEFWVLGEWTDPRSADAGRYTATYWQAETDLPGGRPGVYYISINDPDGEEYAVIIHRTDGGHFPIGGRIANEKLEHSLEICEALNARL